MSKPSEYREIINLLLMVTEDGRADWKSLSYGQLQTTRSQVSFRVLAVRDDVGR